MQADVTVDVVRVEHTFMSSLCLVLAYGLAKVVRRDLERILETAAALAEDEDNRELNAKLLQAETPLSTKESPEAVFLRGISWTMPVAIRTGGWA